MSDGVIAVRTALIAHAPLIALVPAARIIGDDAVPQNKDLPAIRLASVSKIDRNLMSPGVTRHVRERVQVTIYAKTRASRAAILAAVRKAAADKVNLAVSGLTRVTIHSDGAGPDFMGENDVRITTQDFRVTYSETR